MRMGVLAMFDALGFKGIWGRPEIRGNPSVVIDKLLRLERDMNAMLDREFGGDRMATARSAGNVLGQCTLAFLSDTVVLGLATKDPADGTKEEEYRGWDLMVAARTSSMILREAALGSPALAYRGCIAYGEFALEKNFIVGRAVDEAAENMDRAQGAFVWLTPSAEKELRSWERMPYSLKEHALLEYEVPLKGGDRYTTHVVSPFIQNAVVDERAFLSSRILDTFGGSVDIEVKRQRTAEFLRFASSQAEGPEAVGPLSG
jgi:hypothetical protein